MAGLLVGVVGRGGRGLPLLGMQESPGEEECRGQATQTLWWLKDRVGRAA